MQEKLKTIIGEKATFWLEVLTFAGMGMTALYGVYANSQMVPALSQRMTTVETKAAVLEAKLDGMMQLLTDIRDDVRRGR